MKRWIAGCVTGLVLGAAGYLFAQQPVTIANTPTVTANAGTNLNTSALALEASVDGLEGGTGAAGDTAATVGGTGSISAKLRTVTSQLDTISTRLAPWDSLNATAADGATACTNTAQSVKPTAGTFGGYYINNPNTADAWLHVYNVASGSVTVGTTTPKLSFRVSGTAANSVAANLELARGVTFGTAIAIACTSTAGGNGAPSNALEADILFN
jgi:hypothetical protein